MAKIKAIKNLISELSNQEVAECSKILTFPETQKVDATDTKKKETNTQLSNELNDCLSKLIKDVDYMFLPKVEKPILLKNGAIKILKALNLRYSISLVNQTTIPSEKFLSYVSQVSIIDEQDKIIVSSFGSANSHEAKFNKQGMSCDPLIINMSVKRALISATKSLILIYKRYQFA